MKKIPVKLETAKNKGLLTKAVIEQVRKKMRPGDEILIRYQDDSSRVIRIGKVYPNYIRSADGEVVYWDDVLRGTNI